MRIDVMRAVPGGDGAVRHPMGIRHSRDRTRCSLVMVPVSPRCGSSGHVAVAAGTPVHSTVRARLQFKLLLCLCKLLLSSVFCPAVSVRHEEKPDRERQGVIGEEGGRNVARQIGSHDSREARRVARYAPRHRTLRTGRSTPEWRPVCRAASLGAAGPSRAVPDEDSAAGGPPALRPGAQSSPSGPPQAAASAGLGAPLAGRSMADCTASDSPTRTVRG